MQVWSEEPVNISLLFIFMMIQCCSGCNHMLHDFILRSTESFIVAFVIELDMGKYLNNEYYILLTRVPCFLQTGKQIYAKAFILLGE